MKVFVYVYCNPLLDASPDVTEWGWEFDGIYLDLGQRVQFQQLLADAEASAVQYVVVRRLLELGETVEAVCDRLDALRKLGVSVVTLDEDAPPATDRTAVLQLLQQLQSQQHSQKVRQGHARRRLNAQPPPGKAPYGYRRGRDRYVVDRASAPVVKDFFERFLLYGSLRGAVRYLAQRYGKRISVTTGRRWLTNPVYRGDLAYADGRVIRETHAAIISRSEAAQVDRLLRRNRRLAPRTASAPRSLAGLVTCEACGSPMTVTRVTRRDRQTEYLYLRPTDCARSPKCKSLRYEVVLQKTVLAVCENLQRLADRLPLPDCDGVKAGLQGQIAQKQQILEVLPQLCDDGILDAETLKLRIYHVQSEIAQLQAQLLQLPPVNLRETARAVSLPQFWWDLTETERRVYFREFVQKIKISRSESEWTVNIEFIF